ncbi:MAG: GTP-binding protein [Pirellulales bacterium]
MTLETLAAEDQHYAEALSALRGALAQYQGLSAEERAALEADFGHLRDMVRKLETGRVEIVLFGEIDVGKSALINALVGQTVTEVDVRGGWTREVWQVPWSASGYCVPGLEQSQVVLLDTPGINEVNGEERAQMARDAAARADVIVFVTDSDLNETEYSALVELAAGHKPIVVALNKIDIYTSLERQRLLEVLRGERLAGLVAAEDVVPTAANPLEREYIIESADGSVRSELRQPLPTVEPLKARLLEVLERDGKALLALNAAMYAADKSDRIAAIKVRLREQRANQAIMSYAVMKSVAVAVNPISGADVLGGAAIDVTMVVTLGRIYGIDLTWNNARDLVAAIAKAAGWMMLTEALTHAASWAFKGLTLGAGTVITALPQGAAAGYGSFIVGQAAKYYFEHGASWAGEAPKTVVTRILQNTDKESVLEQLKSEIGKKIRLNRHAGR